MSKKPLEIDIVIGVPPDSVKAAKVWMAKQGDLYVSNLAPDVMTGKYSYHETGVSHHYLNLIKRRSGEGRPPGPKLRGMQGFMMLTGWGCPRVLEPTGYQPQPDTRVRRTLVVPKADFGWDCRVWAIERGRKDLVERISSTDPWPTVPVVATLLADWSNPWILVTVSSWKNSHPYEVHRYEPPVPGHLPFAVIPEAFEGTWLEKPGPKFRPGDPFPEEWLREADEFMARERAREEKRAKKLGLWIPPRF